MSMTYETQRIKLANKSVKVDVCVENCRKNPAQLQILRQFRATIHFKIKVDVPLNQIRLSNKIYKIAIV